MKPRLQPPASKPLLWAHDTCSHPPHPCALSALTARGSSPRPRPCVGHDQSRRPQADFSRRFTMNVDVTIKSNDTYNVHMDMIDSQPASRH